MKTKISTYLAIAAMVLGAASCSDDWKPVAPQGELALESLGLNVDDAEKLIKVQTPTGRADGAPSVDVSGYTVTVLNASGEIMGRYTYGTMPEIITLPAAQGYRLEVESHQIERPEFNRPYFKGAKDFDIVANKVTNLGAVECPFSCLKVSVRIADDLKALLDGEPEVVVEVTKGESLTFTGETLSQSGYFAVTDRNQTLTATFRGTIGGAATELPVVLQDVEAGQHRLVTFCITPLPEFPNPGGTIAPGQGITIQGTVENVDIALDPGADEGNLGEDGNPDNQTPEGEQKPTDPENPDQPEQPEVPAPKITSPDDKLLTEVNDIAEFDENEGGTRKAQVHVDCPKGIANVFVKIESNFLTEDFLGAEGIDMTTQFDLATGKGLIGSKPDISAALAGFGFPIKEAVVGKPEIDFDITTFVPLIGIGAEPGDIHSFVIEVVDAEGKSATATLRFTLK